MRDLCIFKYGSIRGAKSSCEAEVLAAKKGLDYLNTKEFKALCRPVQKVVLLSDNQCVMAFNEENTTPVKWKRSPKKDKQRLANIIEAMKASVEKCERGFRAIHITAHTNLSGSKDSENRQLEYKYNLWCDRSARKNLRYNLRGKRIVKCSGFADADNYDVEVPVGVAQKWCAENHR
jgi:ribonuclease HI